MAFGRLLERIIDEGRRLERRVVHDEVDGEVRGLGLESLDSKDSSIASNSALLTLNP